MPEVRITDEMLKTATKAIIIQMQCYDYGHLREDGNFVTTEEKINLLEARAKEAARAALSAALSGMEPVKVKPLEWVTDNFGPDEYIVYAKFFDLRYEIEPPYSAGFNFRIKRSSDIQPFAWRDTLEAAKAAAQADYEQRIRSALLPDASGIAEPVANEAPDIGKIVARVYDELSHKAGIGDLMASGSSTAIMNAMHVAVASVLRATPPAPERAEIERLRKALDGAVWTASVFHRPFASRRGKDRMPTIHSIKGTFATEQEAIAKANEVIAHGRPSIETFIDRETAEPMATFHLTKEGLVELGRIHSELDAALNPEGK